MTPFLHLKKEPILSPKELAEHLPLPTHLQQSIADFRSQLGHILLGNSPKRVVIVGPCSIHDPLSAMEYGMRLKELQNKVEDHILLVMRLYFEKPRTCMGWKGYITDPHLSQKPEPHTGFQKTRQLLLDIAALEIPIATEFLTPYTPLYYGDLITWGCIGARTSASPIHRQMASGLPMPIGFKNSVEGCIQTAIHGMNVASTAQSYLSIDEMGMPVMYHSQGNPHSHLILRGSDQGPNYDEASIQHALTQLRKYQLNTRFIVDCSHGNSNKDALKQMEIFSELMPHMVRSNSPLMGLMLESHLNFGKQSGIDLEYGVSITDSCLDWERTEELILSLNNALLPQETCASSLV